MSTTRWASIPAYGPLVDLADIRVGTRLYVAEAYNTTDASLYKTVSPTPFRTNVSHEPVVEGWCGETNNRSVTALGVWRVCRVVEVKERIDGRST